MKILGQRIRKLRTGAGLTQGELAEKLCLGKSAVSAYETGDRTPKESVIVAIASLFNVTTDWLLGIDERDNIIDLTGFNEHEIRLIRNFVASLVDMRYEENGRK